MGFNPLEEIGKPPTAQRKQRAKQRRPWQTAPAQQRKRLAMVPMRLQKPWAKVRSKL